MIERLTHWNEEYGCWSYRCASGGAAKCLAAYEDTGFTPDECAELAAAKREGRLLVLPETLPSSAIGNIQKVISSNIEFIKVMLED